MIFGGLVLEFIKKLAFSRFFLPKIQIFQVHALNLYFFRFPTHIQSKKSQLAEYDIVEMFTQNLVEVGCVWWVESGKQKLWLSEM
jgi:hypothetical protein